MPVELVLPDSGAQAADTAQQRITKSAKLETAGKKLFAWKFRLTQAIEPLSEREMQVLNYLDSALTSEDIGRELYVSVNTIRTHIKNIYRKLGVNRRAEAVDRARELGLM